MLTLLLLAAAGPAHAVCDDPVFSVIAAPAAAPGQPGVATATGFLDGKDAVGGRFSIDSAYSPAVWRTVLMDVESQDEWVPDRFGYEVVQAFEPNFVYMRFDLGFLANSIKVQRQLVVRVLDGMVGDRFRTCWRMIDPAPHTARIQGWVSPDVEWERASAGWWEVTPQPDGTALVNYQWWAETGKIPVALQHFGLKRALPDLLKAFETRVGELSR